MASFSDEVAVWWEAELGGLPHALGKARLPRRPRVLRRAIFLSMTCESTKGAAKLHENTNKKHLMYLKHNEIQNTPQI